MQNTNKKEFNLTLAGLYPTKQGYWSMTIDPKNYDALQQIEVGGKITIKILSEETREKLAANAKNPKTVPYAFLEYISKEKVAEMDQAYQARNPDRKDGLDI